jgi:hypothetical protein
MVGRADRPDNEEKYLNQTSHGNEVTPRLHMGGYVADCDCSVNWQPKKSNDVTVRCDFAVVFSFGVDNTSKH